MEESNPNNSPSLKLKIRLGSNSNPETPPRITAKEDEKPLKIVIKRAALESSEKVTLESEKVKLSLLQFPRLSEYPKLQKVVAAESLDRWGESDWNAFADDLTSLQQHVHRSAQQLQLQLDQLETWRHRSGPVARDKRQTPTDSPMTPLPSAASGQDVPSTRADDESSSEEGKRKRGLSPDPSYSKRDEGTSSEDEADLEPAETSEAFEAPETEGDGDDVTRVKDPPRRSGAHSSLWVRKRQQSKQRGRGRPRFRGSAGRATRDRKRRNIDDSSGDDVVLPRKGKNNFWQDMEPFFAPFSSEDVKFCTPQGIDEDDPSFAIPPLGKVGHTKAEWDSDSDSDSFRPPSKNLRGHENLPPVNLTTRSISCGDLTQRILAALIEEQILPSLPPWISDDDPLSPTIPPTYDYSHSAMLSLEERIRLELRSLGLLDDDDMEMDGREDDEISLELRRLQKQLKDQICINNEIRAKVSAKIVPVMNQEETQKKDKIANQTLEKAYLKLMRKKRRKTGA